jgi:hypothetical protein
MSILTVRLLAYNSLNGEKKRDRTVFSIEERDGSAAHWG